MHFSECLGSRLGLLLVAESCRQLVRFVRATMKAGTEWNAERK